MKPDYSLITAISAVIGLLFAIYTVYLVHFRRASISAVLGPQIMAFYRYSDREKKEETVGLIVPLTFVNTAMRPGIVKWASLLLWRDDAPDERFYLEWDKFGKFDKDKDQWFHEEEPHPLTVLGNSSVTRMVFFYWFYYLSQRLILREGLYHIVLCYRIRGGEDKMPETEPYEMLIDSKEFAILEKVRTVAPGKVGETVASATVYLWLDGKRKLAHNQLMSKAESERLLGV